MKDILIIGAGVIGCSIARELSRYKADVLVWERGNDVSVGTSKANSGIVHAGFDAKPNTKKAYYNVKGNALFDKKSKELDFPFKRNGSLVLCFDESEKQGVYGLLARGEENGVEGLLVLEGNSAIKEKEPNVSENAVCALYAPTGGIVSPYDMTIAYAENAAKNGVTFEFLKEVVGIQKHDGYLTVVAKDGSRVDARYVINCAGVYSDEINNLVSEHKLTITPRKGDYMLFDNRCGNVATATLFQLPTAMGKGVLVTPTVHGNLLIGPTATDVQDKDDVDTTPEELEDAFTRALLTVPTLNKRMIITQFSGLRAHLGKDFSIGECVDEDKLFNVVGIESPGLTSAPAIAEDVAFFVSAKLGLSENPAFDPIRKAIPCFRELSKDEQNALIEKDKRYGNLVCHCEVVTEGEIVEAIHRTPGARDVDGVKRRTRAGMGRCQAGFCTPKTIEILARELQISPEEVSKHGKGSELILGRSHE